MTRFVVIAKLGMFSPEINKGMGNINGVLVNKVYNLAEGNILYNSFKFCRNLRTISVIFKGFVLK